MKYVILSDSNNVEPFTIPRQLTKINGESLVQRTARLLKENGIEDVIITSHDKRFDNLGAKRYEPKYNYYNSIKNEGYWLNAFPFELLNEPICFLFGDVYYSEDAIKTIVNAETYSTLFFCTYKNKDKRYIKHHDEPLAYKVVDYVMFKEHIERVKTLKDEGKCDREPIVWELYRSINNLDVNTHKMTNNYVAINDESCDIDTLDDIIKLNKKIGEIDMIKCEVIENFTLEKFDELENIIRKGADTKGKLYVGDTFECDEEMAKYLNGENSYNKSVIKVLEVIPKKETIKVLEEEKPKRTRKKNIVK